VSQGGWIAPLAAAESPRVAFVVGVASTGVTPSEQMMHAVAQQLERAHYGSAVVQRVLALRRRYEDHVHGRAPGREDELAAELRAAMDEPWWLLAFLPPIPLDAEGCRLWIEEMDFDPRPVFARVRVPALMFYGEDDAWTPVEPSVQAWREARGDAVEIVVVPEASHELTLPDGSIAPEYEQKLVDWLVSR
jgi:pimeloyl-ACP methyl ester carboxylesterase